MEEKKKEKRKTRKKEKKMSAFALFTKIIGRWRAVVSNNLFLKLVRLNEGRKERKKKTTRVISKIYKRTEFTSNNQTSRNSI